MAVESVNAPAAPPIGVLSAVRRHWIVATLPVILLVGAAVALGLERPPRYTATANLSVGRIYVRQSCRRLRRARGDTVARRRI